MLKIDMHTHILPAQMPDFSERFGYPGFIHLCPSKGNKVNMMKGDTFFREIEPNCFDSDARLAECEQFQVDVQVLSTVPVLFNYWAKAEDAAVTSAFLNDHMASVIAEHPNRFIGLGTVPLQDPDLAIKEMERCRQSLGFPGLQIGSHINDWNLNNPELDRFFAAAQDLDVALMVHPWDMMGKDDTPEYWLPWLVGMPAETCRAICYMIFGGVFEKYPNLRVLFAHGGGSFPATIGRINHGFNVRPDLCAVDNNKAPKEYLGKFWLDSITHDHDMLDYTVNLVGEDKVVFGTDYPFPLGELEPGKLIESSGFAQERKEKLLYKNCFDWLGLDPKEFQRT